jgi:hypothetical protein
MSAGETAVSSASGGAEQIFLLQRLGGSGPRHVRSEPRSEYSGVSHLPLMNS